MSRPDLSVVTLTWNSERFVEPMLRTLFADAAAAGITVEVIMIDNGSRDGTLDAIRIFQADHPELVLLPLGRNLGTTVTRNLGARMARAEHVLILDSDTEIPRGTLASLLGAEAALPAPDRVGLICPKLVYPNGDLQESARRFPTVVTKALRLLRSESLRQRDESLPAVLAGETARVDYAISAAWLLPKRTFERVGYLDEEIFYSPEDVEFCARVWKHGLEVWYYPHATIVHNCQRITNKRPFSRMGLSHAKGLVRYWARYGTFLSRPPRAP